MDHDGVDNDQGVSTTVFLAVGGGTKAMASDFGCSPDVASWAGMLATIAVRRVGRTQRRPSLGTTTVLRCNTHASVNKSKRVMAPKKFRSCAHSRGRHSFLALGARQHMSLMGVHVFELPGGIPASQ